DPHRQRVDEHSGRTLRTLSALHPPEQHRPEHHLAAPAAPRKQLRKCHVEQARRAHAQYPRLPPQPLREFARQDLTSLFHRRAVALNVQQPERGRRLLDLAQHLAEERLVLLTAHPQRSEERRVGTEWRSGWVLGPETKN